MLYKLSVIEVDRDGRLFGRWIRAGVCHVRVVDVGRGGGVSRREWIGEGRVEIYDGGRCCIYIV